MKRDANEFHENIMTMIIMSYLEDPNEKRKHLSSTQERIIQRDSL